MTIGSLFVRNRINSASLWGENPIKCKDVRISYQFSLCLCYRDDFGYNVYVYDHRHNYEWVLAACVPDWDALHDLLWDNFRILF